MIVGVLIPEGDRTAGSIPIMMEECTEGARNGLGGAKGLGKGICAGESWVESGGVEGAGGEGAGREGARGEGAGGECTG